jgi:hypothetical protein
MPKGDGDGISHHGPQFLANPHERVLCLALLGVREVITNTSTKENDQTAVLGIVRAEVVLDPDDVRALQRIMLRAADRRKGGAVLPMETEDEIDAVFAQFESADLEPKRDEDEDDASGDDEPDPDE